MSAAAALPVVGGGYALPYDFVPSPESLVGRLLVPAAERELCDPKVPELARVLKAVKYSPVFPITFKDGVSAFADLFRFKELALEGHTYERIASDLGGFERSKPIRLVQVCKWFEILRVRFNFWTSERGDRPRGRDVFPDYWNRANSFLWRLTERSLIKLGLLAAPEGGLPERCPVCEHRLLGEIEQALRPLALDDADRPFERAREGNGDGHLDDAVETELLQLVRKYHVTRRSIVEHARGHAAPPLPRPPHLSTPYPVATREREVEPVDASLPVTMGAPARPAPPRPQPAPTTPNASSAPSAASPVRAPSTPPAAPRSATPAAAAPCLQRELDPIEVEFLAELAHHPKLHGIARPDVAIAVREAMVTANKTFADTIASIRSLAQKGVDGENLQARLVTSFIPRQLKTTDAEALRGTLVGSLIFRKDASLAERLLEEARDQNPSVKLHEVFALVRQAELTFSELPVGSDHHARRAHLRGTVLDGIAAAMAEREQRAPGAERRSDVRRLIEESLSEAIARAPP